MKKIKQQKLQRALLAKIIAANLIRLRADREMTQLDVANAIGMLRPNYARIEGGKRLPAVDVLYRLSDALGVSADEFRLPTPAQIRTILATTKCNR
jgi:transcriptional regulator with XRE-family HTH domain